MVVDAANNRVGVGTTSPSYQATVFGSSQSTVEIESGSDTGESRLYFTDPTTTGVGTVEYHHNGNTMRFQVNSAERMRLTADGLTFNGDTAAANALDQTNSVERMRLLDGGGLDLSAGNLVLDNGYGIDFSATANGSGTVTHEILDDYEIGTYTPTIDQGVSGVSYSAQVGRYTKIGRVVYFLQHIDVASNSSRTGSQLQLGGLPFTAVNTSNVWGSAWWVYTGGGYNLDTTHITWAIQGGTTRIIAYKNSGAVFTGSNISDANAGFHLAGFYFV